MTAAAGAADRLPPVFLTSCTFRVPQTFACAFVASREWQDLLDDRVLLRGRATHVLVWRLISRQLSYKGRMLPRGQALAKDRQEALSIAAQERIGIQPQARENLGSDHPVLAGEQVAELATSPDEPVDLLLPQGSHIVLANPGLLVIALLGMKADRFCSPRDLGVQLRRALQVSPFVLPGLPAMLGENKRFATIRTVRQ